MIENIIQDLRNQFPSLRFVQFLQPNDSQEVSIVKGVSATSEGDPRMNRIDGTFQIIVRSQEANRAKDRAMLLFEYYKGKHDYTLPAVPQRNKPEVVCAKISAKQFPFDPVLEFDGLYFQTLTFEIIFSA